MKVLLIQLDGKLPNIALMKIASHQFMIGNSVELRVPPKSNSTDCRWLDPRLGDDFGMVYASTIFSRSEGLSNYVKHIYPNSVIGGSGWDEMTKLEDFGIETKSQDYSLYPDFRQSIGYTQRGCRLKCSFCGVPRMEPGKVKPVSTVGGVWRGDPWPRELILLDNDFFGQEGWQDRISEMKDGNFKVSFSQGINARAIHDEEAEAIASVNYRENSMKHKRIYTAWDNKRDEKTLFRGLELLAKHGIKPSHIMVYILIGYDHETKSGRPFLTEDDFHRHDRLREFGCDPYPMPYMRTKELVGFQRWVTVNGSDRRIPWETWKSMGYRPSKHSNKSDNQNYIDLFS